MPPVIERDIRASTVSQSAVASLKAIFSILMGLSVTNTLVVFVRGKGEPFVKEFASIDLLAAVLAAVLLFTIVRFFLGNVRHVDDVYVSAAVDGIQIDPGKTLPRASSPTSGSCWWRH